MKNPPSNPQLETLFTDIVVGDSELYDHFDIRQRLAGLDAKLSFVSDLNTTLLNLLQNRDGHRLEWIVIILIMVEVVLSLIGFFGGTH